jgi:hypothetical protein
LILEKKVTTVNEILENKDLELNQILRAANIRPEDLGKLSKIITHIAYLTLILLIFSRRRKSIS